MIQCERVQVGEGQRRAFRVLLTENGASPKGKGKHFKIGNSERIVVGQYRDGSGRVLPVVDGRTTGWRTIGLRDSLSFTFPSGKKVAIEGPYHQTSIR